MQNPIRYNYGGRILVNTRQNKPVPLSLLETSNIVEIRDYSYNLVSLSNTPEILASTPNNYAIETDLYASGLYNRIYLHNTSSDDVLSYDPRQNFTLAQPNSFFDYNLFLDSNLTFNIRISRY